MPEYGPLRASANLVVVITGCVLEVLDHPLDLGDLAGVDEALVRSDLCQGRVDDALVVAGVDQLASQVALVHRLSQRGDNVRVLGIVQRHVIGVRVVVDVAVRGQVVGDPVLLDDDLAAAARAAPNTQLESVLLAVDLRTELAV